MILFKCILTLFYQRQLAMLLLYKNFAIVCFTLLRKRNQPEGGS